MSGGSRLGWKVRVAGAVLGLRMWFPGAGGHRALKRRQSLSSLGNPSLDHTMIHFLFIQY